jgi:hypothetical protein
VTQENLEQWYERFVKEVSDEMEAAKDIRRPSAHTQKAHAAAWAAAQLAIRRSAIKIIKEVNEQ